MSTNHKIYFRADAGSDIGYGHYIRSLALADMLKHDFECTMFTQTPTDYQLREAKDICKVVALPADETKFYKFLEYLTSDEIVVLDNYFYTTDYQRQIKAKGCKLVCIDDMHDKHYVADVVINHGFAKPTDFSAESYTHFCLGAEYALLRRPFLNPPQVQRQQEKYVITFGGTDQQNFSTRFANLLAEKKEVNEIVVVVGDKFVYRTELKNITKVSIRQHLSAEEMAMLFATAEGVICSASSVCMEAMACGAKVYAGWYVDNQKEGYEEMARRGWIYPLGNLNETTSIDISQDIHITTNPYNDQIIEKYKHVFIDLCK